MNTSEFRDELVKIMPGYNWTIHRPSRLFKNSSLTATGIQSSGFNRLSTLRIYRTEDRDGTVQYEAASAGTGTNAQWLHKSADRTLARALRGLQEHYESMAQKYSNHAEALKFGRIH